MKHTILLFCLLGSFSQSYSQSWQQTNGPGGALINAVAVNSQGDIFVLSNSLFRSTDDGNSWIQIATEIPSGTLINIQAKPSGELFAAQHVEENYHDDTLVWESTNNGNSWNKLIQTSTTPSVYFIPNGSVIILSTTGYFISTDNGTTWNTRTVNNIGQIENFWGDNAGHLFVSADNLFYRSIDSGKNWSKIINGITGGVTGFAEAPNGDLYVVVDFNHGSAVFKSIDGGRVWTSTGVEFRENLGSALTEILISKQGRIAVGISSDQFYISNDSGQTWNYEMPFPGGSQLWAVSSTGMFYAAFYTEVLRSTLDNGLNGLRLDVPTGSVSAVIHSPSGNLVAMNQGLWISSDNGKHWQIQASGGGVPIVFDLSQNLLAGSGGHINHSTDGGLTWNSVSPLLTQGYITDIAVRNPGEIFASTAGEGIFKTSDNSQSWDQINIGMTDVQIFSLAIDQSNNVYAGSINMVYKSSDGGLNWNTLNTNFPSGSGKVGSMTVNTQGNIIAGIENAGVFWSTDKGQTWVQKGTGITTNQINALVSTRSGKVFTATDKGIFFLDIIPGSTWIKLNSGLTATNVLSLTRDLTGRLFAGTDVSGVFESIQTFNLTGQVISIPLLISPADALHDSTRYFTLKWHAVPNAKNYQVSVSRASDFSNISTISDLLTDTTFIFDSHLSSGAPFYWRVQAINETDLSPFSETRSFQIAIPDEVNWSNSATFETTLGSNYPNPFSLSTSIPFSVGKSSYISLEIVDAIGRKVAILANGSYEPGIYEVKFNRDNLADGMYFVRLLTENQSFVKPILISK